MQLIFNEYKEIYIKEFKREINILGPSVLLKFLVSSLLFVLLVLFVHEELDDGAEHDDAGSCPLLGAEVVVELLVAQHD